MHLNMRLFPTQKLFMHSIHKLTKLIAMLTKLNFRFLKSLNGLRMTLGGNFSILTSSEKILSFIMHTALETQGNKPLLSVVQARWEELVCSS